MQISSITNCCKPQPKLNFTGSESSKNTENRPRYKHYEELSDEALGLRSVIKAQEQVAQSGKMRALKALPTITAGIIGASLAITQPGKLSAKAARGLGFLAIVKAASVAGDVALDKFEKNLAKKGEQPSEETALKKLAIGIGATALVAGAAVLGAKKAPKLLEKYAKPVSDFIKKDSRKLAKEINNSKLGQYVENKVNPFIEKHQKGVSVAAKVSPFAAFGGAIVAQSLLTNSLVKDVKEKANENYVKGKIIQFVARREFEKAEGTEV